MQRVNNFSIDFAYAYGWNIFYQKMLGICSKKGEGFIDRQKAWAWALLIFVSLWLPQTASLSILWGDMNMIINCLSTNMSMAMATIKILILQYQRRVIGSILVTIAVDWARVKTEEETLVMKETAKISRFISIVSFSLTIIMFFEYIASQLWILVKKNNTDMDPRLSFGLLHVSYFPFDTTNLAIFVPIWMCQFFGTLLAMSSYSGPDCIVAMMVLHLCGQLRIIRNSLKNLVNETTTREPEKYWRTLSDIIKRHEELNQLAFVIKDTFSTILLIQMLVCSVTFCFQGYAMFTTLMDRNDESLPVLDLAFSVLYAIYTIIHLFIHCYVGDRLLVESTSISDDFYETAWYDLAAKEAKAFLFVCHRSKIPLELKAGKFCTFNLQLFNSIMKNSMGYLSMLMAMKERLID